MGKPTGFLEIERRDRGYEKPEERLKNWNEFVKPLRSEEHTSELQSLMRNSSDVVSVKKHCDHLYRHVLTYSYPPRPSSQHVTRFVKVMPKDYRRALHDIEAEQLAAASVAAE